MTITAECTESTCIVVRNAYALRNALKKRRYHYLPLTQTWELSCYVSGCDAEVEWLLSRGVECKPVEIPAEPKRCDRHHPMQCVRRGPFKLVWTCPRCQQVTDTRHRSPDHIYRDVAGCATAEEAQHYLLECADALNDMAGDFDRWYFGRSNHDGSAPNTRDATPYEDLKQRITARHPLVWAWYAIHWSRKKCRTRSQTRHEEEACNLAEKGLRDGSITTVEEVTKLIDQGSLADSREAW